MTRNRGYTTEWRKWGYSGHQQTYQNWIIHHTVCVFTFVPERALRQTPEWCIWLSCRLVIVFLFFSIHRKVNYASYCGWETILGKCFGNNRLAVYGNHLLPTNVKVNFQTCGVSNYRLHSNLVEGKYMLCWYRLSGSSWHPAEKEHHIIRRMVFGHIKTLSKSSLFARIKANRTRTSHKGI